MLSTLNEFDTIRKVLSGYSLARLGDGEMKMAYGKSYVREAANSTLAAELRSVLRVPSRLCLPCIPTWDKEGPKYESWLRHKERFEKLLAPDIQYGSAFVTRPDSAPWISNRAYAELVQELWAGKNAVILCEKGNSLYGVMKKTTKHLTHIRCPSRGAYAHIDKYEYQIAQLKADVAVLSCGPTATCLADRLARWGVHAIDFGSAGGFLRKLLA